MSSSIHPSSSLSEPAVAPRLNKGKARAPASPAPSESTPLLAPSSRSHASSARSLSPSPSSAARQRRRGLRTTLCSVFLLSLAAAVLLAAAGAALAYSYAARAAAEPPAALLARALVAKGPEHVRVLNVTRAGEGGALRTEIWAVVHARLGIAGARALRLEPDVSYDDDGEVEGGDGRPDGLGVYAWKALGRVGLRLLGGVRVRLGPLVLVSADDGRLLAEIHAPAPVALPITVDIPEKEGDAWLTPVAVTVRIVPTDCADDLLAFARTSWRQGVVAVRAHVGSARVNGGMDDGGGWRAWLSVERRDVEVEVRKKVPALPGMPAPGRDAPLPELARLVHLQSFSVTSANDTLAIRATAVAVNPVPTDVRFTVPSLPFIISLPPDSDGGGEDSGAGEATPVAAVRTAPFAPDTYPNLTLHLSGTVLPLPSQSSSLLSAFLARYLSGRANAVTVHSPLFPGLALPAAFPAPEPAPRVLRGVQIRDMRVRPVGTKVLASGRVLATVVLPPGMRVDVAVRRVLPDVLVFDGPVPPPLPPTPSYLLPLRAADSRIMTHGKDDDEEPAPPAPPLPDPLPAGAFAHLRPAHWLRAQSVPLAGGDPGDGSAVAVSATIVDVPLEVLPGREREFSDFVSKVILRQDALAGLQGTVAVSVQVRGLPGGGGDGGDASHGEMELAGLPFQGEVRIGRRSAGGMNEWLS